MILQGGFLDGLDRTLSIDANVLGEAQGVSGLHESLASLKAAFDEVNRLIRQ
jgi:hypothetical protein